LFNINRVTTIACILTATGCTTPHSEVPTATNFQTSSQKKLQAASHWGLITNDLSKKINAKMDGKVDKSTPLFISSTNHSPFNQAVVAELISSLLSQGYTIVKRPKDAIRVDVDTQVLQFSPDRLQAKTVGIPTLIATGLWAVAEASSVSAAGVATGVIAGSDALIFMNSDKASGQTPKTEIIVGVTVSDEDKYIANSRGTYYVSDTDQWLYKAAQTRALNVQGDK